MARIVNQHNILQPLDRETKYTIAKNKDELLKEIQYDCIAYDLRIYKNGILELEDFEVSESDYILVQVVPKGGNMGGILKVVAMIGIAVLAPAFVGATGIFAEGAMLGGYGLGLSGMTAGFVAGGIILGGGLLINALLPTPTASLNLGNSNLDTSSTYSWDNSYNKSQQGTPIPKVFGTHKVTPPLIAKYIESIDDKQYFHGLYALNDGQIANVSNIKINDESIDNFDNVLIDIRYGTNNQLIIPDFATTRFDKSVNQKLNTDFDTTTSEDGVTELTAVIYFPRGLYYMNDSAQTVSNSVKLIIEYSSDGVNWYPMTSQYTVNTYSEYYASDDGVYAKYNSSGTFISYVSDLPTNAIKLSNGTNTPLGVVSAFNQYYGVPLSYIIPYETITASSTSAFRKTFTKKYLTAGTYQVRAKLYEAPLSGSRYGSDVYFEYLEMGVNDGFIYPNTALLSIRALATDQLSGSTPTITCNVTANSDNPSLIAQSILNEVSNVTSFDSTFTDFQTECNTQNYKCNIVFDSNINVRQALDLVTLNGRASIQQFGSKYAVIMDKKDVLPTQVFTFGMGNILSDTFKQSYLPINDRANIINVSYYDKDDDYKRTVIEISNTTFDNVIDRKVSELNLIGCVDRNQAVKHANYQLKCNRYLSETIQFEAFHDSLVCKYGDIVGISHDLPQYGYSGRIVSCNSTTIILDNPVTFTAGKTYVILLRNKNNQIQEITVTGTGTTSTLTISGTLSYTFAQYDNYMFGETNKAYKLFRVVQISTGTDLTRQLTCIEYNSNVYDDSATVNVPIISDLGLKNLYISDYIRYKQNTNEIETVVNLKWTGTSLKYKIYLDNEFIGNSNDTYFDYITNLTGIHTFKIVDINGKSISQTYNILGKLAKPTDITVLNGSESGNLFKLNWTHDNKDIDFKEYQIFLNNTYIGSTTELFYEYKSLGLDTKLFTVKSVDTSNISSNGLSISITAKPPMDIKNFKVDNAFNTRKVLSWDYNKEDDFKSFEIRMAIGSVDNWDNAISIHNGDITQSPFVWDYAGYKQYTLFIKAIDAGGNYSLNADRILFNVGDMNLDNILSTVSQSPTWSGALINGTVSSGKLNTLTDTTNLYYQTNKYGKSSFYDGGLLYEENNFYSGVSSNYVYGRKVPILDYTFYTNFPIGGNIKFIYDILGDFTLKYVLVGGNRFYSDNANIKYNGGNLYSDYTNFTEYNKPFTIENNTTIKWAINSTGGALQASKFDVICDVEDKYELFNDKVIPVGGIQIAPTQSFYQIQNVLVTLQGQGIPRVTSKNPTGATIQVFNASGTDIGGVADIQYKGY